jgi:hypothetical protein
LASGGNWQRLDANHSPYVFTYTLKVLTINNNCIQYELYTNTGLGCWHHYLYYFFAAGNQNMANQIGQRFVATDAVVIDYGRADVAYLWLVDKGHSHHLYQQHGIADEPDYAIFQINQV